MLRKGSPLRHVLALIVALVTALWLIFGGRQLMKARAATPTGSIRHVMPGTPIRRQLDARLDSLASALRRLNNALAANRRDESRAAFRDARRLYKRSDALIAFYSPTLTSQLNGPVEADDPEAPPAPLGRRAPFGIIEQALFGASASSVRPDVKPVVNGMLRAVQAFRAATPLLEVSDTAALDAARLELARVSTVGIAGFDSDESGDAIVESAEAVSGVGDIVRLLQSSAAGDTLREQTLNRLASATRVLRNGSTNGTADRFGIISDELLPSARLVLALRRAIDPGPIAARRLWRPLAATPYDSGAFDPSALAPEYAPPTSPGLVALGARMFDDPALSGDGSRSCATCHQHSRAFTDGLPRAATMLGAPGSALRNTPTLLNAALQPAMFADQRAGYVEDQIRIVLSSGSEMGSSPELAARRVAADASYASLLRRLGSVPPPIDERFVRVALAAYIRSLVAMNAPFDRAVRGEPSSFSAGARRGFDLFMGKARCGTCHFAPTFGGTMPPDFTRSEPEIIGVPAAAVNHHARLDADSGRAAIDGASPHVGAFRVPSLRNVALTAPYMHNGVYRTLDDVIDFYDRGGGSGIGARVDAQTLDSRPLHLSRTERSDLVEFLRSLTDTVVVARP